MGLYLYCLGPSDHPGPAGIDGIGGARVSALATEGFSAWVSDMDAAPAASLERVREHNQVVEAACARRTALPLRFGQWFADQGSLAVTLRDRHRALQSGLRRVAGAMEMGVRILDPAFADDEPTDRSTGRAYMEALARREALGREARARGTRVAAALREFVGLLAREERIRPLGTPDGLVAVAHLVDRHDIGGYNARVRDFSKQYDALRFHFSGPWPPYGFVDDERPDAP